MRVDALLETWQQQMRELGDASRRRVRPHLREQGGRRRRQQPAPALPDLRDQLHVQVHRDGAARRTPAPRRRPAASVPGHPRGRAAGRAPPRLPTRQRDRVRPVLRALRLRNLRRAPAERRDHCGSGRRRAAGSRDGCSATWSIRFDNLWRMPFPYVMALHQAPAEGRRRGFHFHIEFHPPLRRPNLLKYLAGPEIGGGNFLSDTSPEEKAAELRGRRPVRTTSRRRHDRRTVRRPSHAFPSHPLLAPSTTCIDASAATSSRRASRRRH